MDRLLGSCRFLRLLAAVLVLAVAVRARGADETGGRLPPRDVSVVVQPDAAKLPPPAGRLRAPRPRWMTLELPASIGDRSDALLHEADAFRARLAEDFGQPALEHVVVRVARTPEQMAELAPGERSAPGVRRGRRVPVAAPRAAGAAGARRRGRRPISRSCCGTS